MKKQINQLKELAMSCESFAIKMNLKNDAFSEFKTDSCSIQIYCASAFKTISVYFRKDGHEINVSLYTDKITIPMSMNVDQIKQNIVHWKEIIQNDFKALLEKREIEKQLIIQDQIESLQKELEELQNQIS